MINREINGKSIKKIFKGKDLEFRIAPYQLKALDHVSLSEEHIPNSLTFTNCSFRNLEFYKSRFSGNLTFEGCQIDKLVIKKSQLSSLCLEYCVINELVIKGAEEMHEFVLNESKCNKLTIKDNLIFKLIRIGCGSEVVKGKIVQNGHITKNSFDSEIFFCPESFEQMTINDNCAETFEVGTFGEFANLKIERNKANAVVFSNCNPDRSFVYIDQIQPFKKEQSSFRIVNSMEVQKVLASKDISQYKVVKEN